jgi:hypothetical protein
MSGEKNPSLDFDSEWGLINSCFLKRDTDDHISITGHALTFSELLQLIEYLSKRIKKGGLTFGALDDALLEFEASLERSLEAGKITKREHALLVIDYVGVKCRLRALGIIASQSL